MNNKGIFALVGLGFVGLVVLFTALGSWYTIDAGERGVILRNGALSGIATEGLNFKIPWMDAVTEISVRQDTAIYDSIVVYSRDQQPLKAIISVTWSIPDTPQEVENVYRYYKTRDNLLQKVLTRRVNEQAEIVFGKYSAPEIPVNRAKISLEISNAIKKIVEGTPILVSSAQLENFDLNDEYEQSVAARMKAEVEVQKAKQVADQAVEDARATVTKAQAEADAVLAAKKALADGSLLQAKADAESTRLRGQAEAEAIEAKGKALQDNPQIVALTQAERWTGTLPTYVTSGAPIPFLGIK